MSATYRRKHSEESYRTFERSLGRKRPPFLQLHYTKEISSLSVLALTLIERDDEQGCAPHCGHSALSAAGRTQT
eukprot:3482764-Amphidinium_carterae.2